MAQADALAVVDVDGSLFRYSANQVTACTWHFMLMIATRTPLEIIRPKACTSTLSLSIASFRVISKTYSLDKE